jgi:hypothetical protein
VLCNFLDEIARIPGAHARFVPIQLRQAALDRSAQRRCVACGGRGIRGSHQRPTSGPSGTSSWAGVSNPEGAERPPVRSRLCGQRPRTLASATSSCIESLSGGSHRCRAGPGRSGTQPWSSPCNGRTRTSALLDSTTVVVAVTDCGSGRLATHGVVGAERGRHAVSPDGLGQGQQSEFPCDTFWSVGRHGQPRSSRSQGLRTATRRPMRHRVLPRGHVPPFPVPLRPGAHSIVPSI